MPSTSRTKTAKDQADEVPEWDLPPTEGDPSIGAGQQVEPAEGVVIPDLDDVLQNMMDWCQEYMLDHAADNAQVMAAEVRRILAGESAEEVLAESTPLNGKDHLDKPFMLRSFTLNPTDFTEGWPFYAAMECEIPGTGDMFVMTCGGMKVIAALRRLHEMGEYPYAVKIKGTQTRGGNMVLQLVMAGA